VSRFIEFVSVIIGGAIYLLVGLHWSRGSWSRGPLHFDLGWLLVAVVISQGTAVLYNRNSCGMRRQWLRILLGWCLGILLESLARYSLYRFDLNLGGTELRVFAALTGLFLFWLLYWIAAFPYEHAFWQSGQSQHPKWRAMLFWTSALMGAGIFLGAILIMQKQGKLTELKLLDSVELWFYKSSLIVYLFLALRMFFPIREEARKYLA
jgi:hypothetical protein